MGKAEKMRALAAIAEEVASEELFWKIHDAATEEEDKEYSI